MPVELNSAQRKNLRGLAQNLRESATVGKLGLTPVLVESIRQFLSRESLIKVRILDDDRKVREQLAQELVTSVDACLCGSVGKTISIYRPGDREISF